MILSEYNSYTISFPKGVSAKPASLKCCSPNGIPMMVMQSNTPNARCERLIQIPPTNIQMIFINTLRHPPSPGQLRTSRPKGQRASMDNFKVWKPKGMPMMVTISNRLERIYSTQIRNPPQISQRILSSKFIKQI